MTKLPSKSDEARIAALKEAAKKLEGLIRSGNAGMGAFRRLQDIRVALRRRDAEVE